MIMMMMKSWFLAHFWRIFSIYKAKAKVKAKTLHLTDETNDNVCDPTPLW